MKDNSISLVPRGNGCLSDFGLTSQSAGQLGASLSSVKSIHAFVRVWFFLSLVFIFCTTQGRGRLRECRPISIRLISSGSSGRLSKKCDVRFVALKIGWMVVFFDGEYLTTKENFIINYSL